ncbi:YqhV family protein [Bacillus tianshenii]|uniref:YqhV family protein n=1 Tax=Sutcliffiella tianshenii TaxID=1463404 RepID=UPI001CD440A2|nr:YqhV family protein [Bacillus tianshenii]MCA1320576.1 YqhV family protein [Bacillus tianshenii]
MKKLLGNIDPAVLSMAGIRIFSGVLELTAAFIMLYLNDVKKAVVVNSMLAVVGPVIFISTMMIGLVSMANEISFSKLVFIAIGVGFILYGIYK